MGVLDQLGGMLEQYTSGNNVTREQAHNDYDRIAATVPKDVLASSIGPALSSLGSDQVRERVRNSAGEMSSSQRGSFLTTLLNSAAGGGGIASMLQSLGVNPSVAQQPDTASPDDVAKVATHVHDTRPDAFNQAMGFFSEHPTLVKVLGTIAIAKIAQHLSSRG